MKKADSSLSAIPHADKSFRVVEAKDAKQEDAPYDYERDGLRSADLLINDGLQADSKRALAEDDYLALETLSKQRLALVPTSLMAQKNLAQAQFRRSQDSLEARRFKEAEGLLLECLAWQRGQMGERHEAVGRSLLQLAKCSMGMANRRQALERARLSHGILLDCRVTDAALSEVQDILASLEAQGAK